MFKGWPLAERGGYLELPTINDKYRVTLRLPSTWYTQMGGFRVAATFETANLEGIKFVFTNLENL